MIETLHQTAKTFFPQPTLLPFVGDHFALNVLNSVAAPRDETIDEFANGDALLSWLMATGTITLAEIETMRSKWNTRELEGVAKQARELREWFRPLLAQLKTRNKGVSDTIAAKLNPLLLLAGVHERLENSETDGRLTLIKKLDLTHTKALLALIASAIAKLISEEDLELVRRCENPNCTMWFYDRTKGHRRRWCSQAVCGNRAKVAAFRARGRTAQTGE